MRACFPLGLQGDGYLAHEEFKGMVSSLNIMLSGEQIRSVIRAIDLDGGGYIDFPEFEAAVKRHEEVGEIKMSVFVPLPEIWYCFGYEPG